MFESEQGKDHFGPEAFSHFKIIVTCNDLKRKKLSGIILAIDDVDISVQKIFPVIPGCKVQLLLGRTLCSLSCGKCRSWWSEFVDRASFWCKIKYGSLWLFLNYLKLNDQLSVVLFCYCHGHLTKACYADEMRYQLTSCKVLLFKMFFLPDCGKSSIRNRICSWLDSAWTLKRFYTF